MLPFDCEGLFALAEVYFPVYNTKGARTRWRPAELAICSYHGAQIRHSVATRPDYHSAYLASLIPEEWDIDAQEYTSCYGRFVNDNFSPGSISCKLQPFANPDTGEMQIWVVALPGVRILPGEELYAEYGKNYSLDHLPSLPPEARRHCIQKYKCKASELLKAGLRSDESRLSPAPSIVSFPRAPPPAPPTHSLFLHEDTISEHSTFRLYFAQPSSPRLTYDPSLSLLERRSLLHDYFLKEPVLQLHIQEPADLYNVCVPDGSCAIQLALLYQCLDHVDWTAELSLHDPCQSFFQYRQSIIHSSINHSDVLRLVRSLIDLHTDPGTHV